MSSRTPKDELVARMRRVFKENGGRMTEEQLVRLCLQAEIFTPADMEEFVRRGLELEIEERARRLGFVPNAKGAYRAEEIRRIIEDLEENP